MTLTKSFARAVPKSHRGTQPLADEGAETPTRQRARTLKAALKPEKREEVPQPVFDKRVWFALVRKTARVAQEEILTLAATFQGLALGVENAAKIIESVRGEGSFETRLYGEVLNSAFALQALTTLLKDNLPEDTHAALTVALQERLFRAPASTLPTLPQKSQDVARLEALVAKGQRDVARALAQLTSDERTPSAKRGGPGTRRGGSQLPDVQTLVDVLQSKKGIPL